MFLSSSVILSATSLLAEFSLMYSCLACSRPSLGLEAFRYCPNQCGLSLRVKKSKLLKYSASTSKSAPDSFRISNGNIIWLPVSIGR